MIRIDAHHHVWTVSRGDYDWLTPDLPIHRDYTLDDLRALLGNITATVLVQAAPTEAETAFMIDVARGSDSLVRAVVGWVDMLQPDAPERIARLGNEPLVKGLRPMLQDIPDTKWVLQDALRPAFQAMIDVGLRFDALIQPRHLRHLVTLCTHYPDLRVVIDHGAKPSIAEGVWQPWADEIRRVAYETAAYCKLSGLVTEAPPGWRIDDLRRYADHLFESFGPSRLMWGSDWPVVNLAGGYRLWQNATEVLLAVLSAETQDAILGSNALDFYGLSSP